MNKTECSSSVSSGLLIEAEDFENHGGWVLDSQFETVMGSPYLLAHGMGRPVIDASTAVAITNAGEYEVWVRTKDWAPPHHPGRFTLSINGAVLDTIFGTNGKDWSWQSGGRIWIPEGKAELTLHDLTGFYARCDAIYLSLDGVAPPNTVDAASRAWRKAARGLPDQPIDAGIYDVIVVGGGIAGCAAALTAARLGDRVALIQDRPVLGGNASREIGLSPRGTQGALLEALSARTGDGDLQAQALLEAEPTATLFLGHRIVDVGVAGGRVVSVDAVQAHAGHERRFRAPMFIDCTGTAILGVLAGAKTLFGREAALEFNESYAPEVRDDMHHGNTLFFRTRMASEPISFPDVPWAIEVAKDYANLSGQLVEPGVENGPGPAVNPNSPEFQFSEPTKPWMQQFPATHYWEYGQWLDPYTEGEYIRDYLLRALFGTFWNVKRLEPEKYANLEFDWVAYVAAQGEFRRYQGDYILTQNDIVDHRMLPDTLVFNDGAFCLHCAYGPEESQYDFRLKDWIWDTRDKKPYGIPFRCLYSVNIENLMMAGKHISVTHVAGSSTKFMGNGAQHGIAVGAAAHLCAQRATTPRGLYEHHLGELKKLVSRLTVCDHGETSPP